MHVLANQFLAKALEHLASADGDGHGRVDVVQELGGGGGLGVSYFGAYIGGGTWGVIVGVCIYRVLEAFLLYSRV